MRREQAIGSHHKAYKQRPSSSSSNHMTVTFLEQPSLPQQVEDVLHPLVKEWFYSKYPSFSQPQLYGVKEIHERNNILISAPTGGTKTLTAFLSIINELVTRSVNKELQDRVYAVYLSPLKALNNDVSLNLSTPLAEITQRAKEKGIAIDIRVGVRTGDTSPADRQKMLRKPPHILITTPESLALMLTSYKFCELLRGAEWCVVDEIHALAENKRGVHLSLMLERLEHISPSLCRVGLSATIEPLEEIAQYLVGTERSCKIAHVKLSKKVDMQVISPVPNLIDVSYEQNHRALYKLLDELIDSHKTTLIFTNTRAGTERVVHHLKEMYPSKYVENIGAHHGSLSKRHRFSIESNLKEGKLKAVVCSTSLELGIDIGYIDLVVCLGSPKSVARLLQRAGRAGHKLHDTVKARIIVLDRDDLVECSVMLKSAIEKKIDRIQIPQNCLDVLAQVIHGVAVMDRWNIEELFQMIRKSYCYRSLKKEDFLEVIRYLAGEFVELEDRYIFGKIWYDEKTGELGKRGRLSHVIHMTNIGTIPDQTGVRVKVGEKVVGTIEEAFVEKLKRGDIFVLGGDTYEFLFSRGMTAQVRASAGKLPTVPSWFSEMLPLSFDLAVEIQKFRRCMEDYFINTRSREEIMAFIHSYLYVDKNAAASLYAYFKEQFLYSRIPHERRLVVEHVSEDYGDGKKYVLFHTLYGRRVNDVLSRAVGYILGKINKRDVEIGINDNGFYIASDKPMQAQRAFSMIKAEELHTMMESAIDKTEVLKRRFRHCAGRALMILREYKGVRKGVGRQQVSSMILLSAVKRISQDFCILKEAKREVLYDLMDITHAQQIVKEVQDGKIELVQTHHSIPSPFAFNMITQSHADIMRMEDRMDYINRMHHLVLAKIGKTHKIDDHENSA